MLHDVLDKRVLEIFGELLNVLKEIGGKVGV